MNESGPSRGQVASVPLQNNRKNSTQEHRLDRQGSVAMANMDLDRDPIDMAAEEFCLRQRRGEHPSIDEYCQLYPEHADQIRELFPAIVAMEQLKSRSTMITVLQP